MSWNIRLWIICLLVATPLFCQRGRADDWPQWLGPKRDGIWRETGIVTKFRAGGPALKWRAPVGAGYSGPAVVGGRVYLTDRLLSQGASNPGNPFEQGRIPGRERVLCLEESSGRVLWEHAYPSEYTISYPSGPRATPVVDGENVYTLGAEGILLCLRQSGGSLVWSNDLRRAYSTPTPLWGFAGHPLVDGDKLICLVGGEGSTAVAFDKASGRELWRALTAKEPGYCPPMIFELAGKRTLVIWHPESVNGLDPETGRIYWSQPAKIQSALTVPTPRAEGDHLFLSSFYNGSLMLNLASGKPAVVWQSKKVSEIDTDGLHSITSTPFMENGFIYGVCSYGQLRGLNATTGERLWETLQATTKDRNTRWANAFIVKQADRFFLFNELGDLIIANLSPQGYRELDRAHLIEPTEPISGRFVVWSHPAFAHKSVYVRNQKELAAFSLADSQ